MSTKATRISIFTLAASALLSSLSAYAYPTGGWGWSTWLGGSNLRIDWETTDNNGVATIQLNYFDEDGDGIGRLCISGEVNADYNHGTLTGKAVYKLLGPDDGDPTTADTQGICYSYVSQSERIIEVDANGDPIDVGKGTAYEYTYTVPSLGDIVTPDIVTPMSLDELLTGRMQVIQGTATDALAVCNTDVEALPICNFLIGIDFKNEPIPSTFFPATVTTNGDSVDPNVVLYSNEICVEFDTADLGLGDSFAINAKSQKIRSCEALAIKGDWCSDLTTQGTSDEGSTYCDVANADGQLATGGFNNAAGDFIKQQDFNVACINDVNDLRNLGCGESVNLAACSDGSGLIEMPSDFTTSDFSQCVAENPIELSFSSSDGGGVDYVNVGSILNYGSPGYPGDNNTPACSAACITSTPNNTEINEWDFSTTYLFSIGYIDGQGGDDIITGSKGPDTIRGGSGVDRLDGYLGDDVLLGGDNEDILIGNEGNDLLIGYDCFGPNSDCSVVLNNGSDNDDLNGGPGNDCIDGGRGNDVIDGGPGADAIILYGDTDSDIIDNFNSAEGDRFVALNVSASVKFIDGKRGAADACVIETGGNNAITYHIANKTSQAECEELAGEIATSIANFPQCQGHPGSF